MTFEEITKRFNDCPSAMEVAEIEREKDVLLKRYNALSKQQRKLHDSLEIEEDGVADELDKECEDWRIVLANGNRKK